MNDRTILLALILALSAALAMNGNWIFSLLFGFLAWAILSEGTDS